MWDLYKFHKASCCFEVLVNFEEVFALFHGAFIVDFEYSLFMVNVIKCYLMAYLCGTPKGAIFMGVVAKH